MYIVFPHTARKLKKMPLSIQVPLILMQLKSSSLFFNYNWISVNFVSQFKGTKEDPRNCWGPNTMITLLCWVN